MIERGLQDWSRAKYIAAVIEAQTTGVFLKLKWRDSQTSRGAWCLYEPSRVTIRSNRFQRLGFPDALSPLRLL